MSQSVVVQNFFLGIPRELRVDILSRVSLGDLARTEKVCHELRDCIFVNDKMLFKHHCVLGKLEHEKTYRESAYRWRRPGPDGNFGQRSVLALSEILVRRRQITSSIALRQKISLGAKVCYGIGTGLCILSGVLGVLGHTCVPPCTQQAFDIVQATSLFLFYSLVGADPGSLHSGLTTLLIGGGLSIAQFGSKLRESYNAWQVSHLQVKLSRLAGEIDWANVEALTNTQADQEKLVSRLIEGLYREDPVIMQYECLKHKPQPSLDAAEPFISSAIDYGVLNRKIFILNEILKQLKIGTFDPIIESSSGKIFGFWDKLSDEELRFKMGGPTRRLAREMTTLANAWTNMEGRSFCEVLDDAEASIEAGDKFIDVIALVNDLLESARATAKAAQFESDEEELSSSIEAY